MSALVLAFPSKGRLQEQCADYFADCGLRIAQDGGARGYSAQFVGLPEIEIRLISAGDIARAVAKGEVHLGVTGEDVLREADPGMAQSISVMALGFGRADLVLATPQSWLDVTLVSDFAEVAAQHRARTGERLRVATKYLVQAQAFLDARGVSDYRLVESLGATEAAPANGASEAIIDITTTGATLSANHLRPLDDGVILRSQALLAASARAQWNDAARAGLARLLSIVEARQKAKGSRLLRVAPGKEGPEALAARAAELGCRVASELSHSAMLELYCPAEKVFAVCAALQGLFGGAISVVETDFLFESPCAASARFEKATATRA